MRNVIAAFALSGLAVSAANAQLMFAPSATDTVLTSTSNVDDLVYTPSGAAAFNLSGFSFFGTAVTNSAFSVNNNGSVSFGSAAYRSSSYGNVALPFTSNTAGQGMIAAYWDDLFLTGPGTGVNSKSLRIATPDAGTYVITFQGEEAYQNTSPDLNLQIVLYGAGNSAGAAPGTITLAYGTMLAGTHLFNGSIGLNAGNGTTSAVIPSIGGGFTSNATLGSLANSRHSFIPDGNGGYAYQAGSVPTPGAAALLGLGGLAAFRRRRA